MSQWYYQMLGEEFGPVSEDSLKQLIADGMLDATDPVRPADSSDWRPVNQTDLMSAADAPNDDPTDVLTDLDELNFRFEESGATDRSARRPRKTVQPPPVVEVPEAAPAPTWFHQFFGQVLGPITMQELVQLAESGNLNEADSVRCGVTGEWQPAGDVPELAAAFILSTGGVTAKGPQASAGSGRSLFAAAAAQAEKVKAQADAERAAAAAAEAAAAARSQSATAPKPTAPDSTSRSATTTGSPGRRGGKKSEAQLVENILSEVFAEPAAPRETSSNRSAEQSASAGGTNTGESRPPAAMAGNSSSAPNPAATAAGSGWSGASAAAPRPSLSSPAPAKARSSGSRSSGGGFSLPTGQVPLIGGVILLAVVGWFGYGYVNRLISVDEPKYIRRVEESIAVLEKLSPQASQTELDTVQGEIYREFNEYIRTMTGAGATTGNSKKCLAAINRLTELIRVDPNRNPDLRKKLMADAKQMVSEWKANK
jgi:hypothetical protein